MIYSPSIVKCSKCKRPAKVGCTRCQPCLSYEIRQTTRRRAERKAKGLCTTCRGQREPQRGHLSTCFACSLTNMVHRRNHHLKRRYGLTYEEVEALRKAQGGFCAFCGLKLNSLYFIDHDHYTNEVRGIVHPRCNTVLGLVEQFGKDRLYTLLGQYAGGVW